MDPSLYNELQAGAASVSSQDAVMAQHENDLSQTSLDIPVGVRQAGGDHADDVLQSVAQDCGGQMQEVSHHSQSSYLQFLLTGLHLVDQTTDQFDWEVFEHRVVTSQNLVMVPVKVWIITKF